jgi:hypothetical protein
MEHSFAPDDSDAAGDFHALDHSDVKNKSDRAPHPAIASGRIHFAKH